MAVITVSTVHNQGLYVHTTQFHMPPTSVYEQRFRQDVHSKVNAKVQYHNCTEPSTAYKAFAFFLNSGYINSSETARPALTLVL